MIEVIKTKEDFEALKDTWDALYSRIEYKTPFQSYSFNYNSWSILEKHEALHIIIISKDMELQAIFPCVLTKRSVLQFINGIHSDFCGALIDEEVRKCYHLYKELADYIKESSEIKGFMFDNLKEDNYLASILGYFFKSMQTRITNRWSYFTVSSQEPKDKSFLDGMHHLNSKERYKLKKRVKKETSYDLKIFDISEEVYPTEIIDDIINTMLSSGMRTEAYFSDDFKHIIENLYNDGLLSVAVTSENNTALVANLFLMNGNEWLNWLVVYRDGQYNTANLLQMVDHIYTAGGGIFNFARGIYEYKVSNFRPEIHNLYRVEYAKSLKDQIGVLMSFYKYYLKVFLKPIIRK